MTSDELIAAAHAWYAAERTRVDAAERLSQADDDCHAELASLFYNPGTKSKAGPELLELRSRAAAELCLAQVDEAQALEALLEAARKVSR